MVLQYSIIVYDIFAIGKLTDVRNIELICGVDAVKDNEFHPSICRDSDLGATMIATTPCPQVRKSKINCF